MLAKIKYGDIKGLNPEEAVHYLNNVQKWKVSEARLMDVLNEDGLQKPLIDSYFKDLSPCGVYLFYDAEGCIRYIGQTHKSFYERLLTQLDTTYYAGFAWNTMLSRMGCQRCNKPHAELTWEDHEIDFQTVCNWKLLIIDTGSHNDVAPEEIVWLEKMLLKAYREIGGEYLLNNRIGWLRDEQWTVPLEHLIK